MQCPAGENLAVWSDARFWDVLRQWLPDEVSCRLETGPAIETSVAPLRSFVVEPLSHGRLFLVGDAGHIVPPTGAKGLNLAASDIYYLSSALITFYRSGDEDELLGYSAGALRRIWKSERFSWWMTMMMHHLDDDGGFGHRMQIAELDYLNSSQAAMTALAENYVGLPYD